MAWRRVATVALLTALGVTVPPVAAQQTMSAGAAATRQKPLLLQPPAPDLGAATTAAPRLARPGESDSCAPAWPCRLQLFGNTGKYGGIGLKGTALTW